MQFFQHTLRNSLLALPLMLALAACGGGESPESTVPDEAARTEAAPAMSLQELQMAVPVKVTPQQIAEAFALGSRSTDLQRELLEKELVGQVVEWDLVLYEVALEGEVYTVTSQPIKVPEAEGTQLIRIVAQVRARNEAEHAFLRAIKTDDPIRLRGRATGIFLRTITTLDPAVVVLP